jgi:hypothetical protein
MVEMKASAPQSTAKKLGAQGTAVVASQSSQNPVATIRCKVDGLHEMVLKSHLSSVGCQGEIVMRMRRKFLAAASALMLAGLAAASQVRAGADRVAFPENYNKGVRYLTLDKPDSRDVRDYYASQAAAEAAKNGMPLPDGTVITVVQYAAALDADGKPTTDANGRLIRTDKIIGYVVMEKRAGWGDAYAEVVRNGDWEYRVFRPDKTPNTNANMTSCFTCHRPQAAADFIFTRDSLKAAVP